MNLVFALPAETDAVSGGNIFNAELIRELRAVVPVTSMTFDECADAIRRGAKGLYFVDTLNLGEVLSLPPLEPEQTLALVVHHLPSLEPGIDPADESLQIEASTLPRFEAYLVTSPFSAEYLAGKGIRKEKIMTVLPGLRPMDPEPRPYEPPLRALMVANVIRRKAVLEFLAEVASRVSDGDEFEIDVLGRLDMDANYVMQCRALVAERLGDSVRLKGAVSYDEMNQWYRTRDLLVSAAQMETYGMALAEARAHGLPILALDRGHVRNHFTNGENGVLLDSMQALAERFLALVREPGTMSRLFTRAQRERAASDYGWKAAAAQFLGELERWSKWRLGESNVE